KRFGFRAMNSGAFPPRQRPFVFEPKPVVNLLAGGSGVELEATQSPLVQVFDGLLQQGPADAAPAMVRMHQYHADPRQRRIVNDRRGGARRHAIPLGKKTAVWFSGEKTFPVRDGLIPTRERPNRIRERQVFASQQPKSKRGVHCFPSALG